MYNLICTKCGKEFSRKNKTKTNNVFCSISCSISFNNTGIQRNKLIFPKNEDKKEFCEYCKQKLPYRNKKFCNIQCNRNFTFEKDWTDFNNGSIVKSDSLRQGSKIRDKILEIQEYKCSICGIKNEWNGKELKFVLDHIDGNSENTTLKNIRLICHNCDSQTNTYKGKNSGNGRFVRRQRYKENKSY